MDALEAQQTQQPTSQFGGRLARGAHKLRIAFIDECRRRSWRHQFDFWDEHGETDSVLEAIGVERGQIPLFIRRISAGERLMAAMRARIRVRSRLTARTPAQREALWVCAFCPSRVRCQQWLDLGATTGFEEFCPNASVFCAERVPSD